MPVETLNRVLYVWSIIVGGLIIFIYRDHIDVQCIVCSPVILILIGLISIALGVAGFVLGRRGSASVGR